jgi:hypothetical protein
MATIPYFQGQLFDVTTVYPLGPTTIFTTPTLSTGIWQITYQQTVWVTGGTANSLELYVSPGTASIAYLGSPRSGHTPPFNTSSYTISTLVQVTSPGTITLGVFNAGLTMRASGVSGGVGISYCAVKIA